MQLPLPALPRPLRVSTLDLQASSFGQLPRYKNVLFLCLETVSALETLEKNEMGGNIETLMFDGVTMYPSGYGDWQVKRNLKSITVFIY